MTDDCDGMGAQLVRDNRGVVHIGRYAVLHVLLWSNSQRLDTRLPGEWRSKC